MLHNIKPRPPRARNKDSGLTLQEKKLVNGLLAKGYQQQDVAFIVNQGRSTTVNQGRITRSENVETASDEQVKEYLEIQSAYDAKTLLNPYKDTRLIRAREAMQAAVQTFNNPTTIFRAELFCVLANIAWTYLLHEKLERTKVGSSKIDNGNSITVGGTLDKQICPIKDAAVIANLKEIVKVRDQVEHTFFVGGNEYFGHLFQACCVNFEKHMTEWFGVRLSLAKELSLALQFVRLQKDQIVESEKSNLPSTIKAMVDEIQNSEFANNNAFLLKVHYTTEVSSKTNADIHKLIAYDGELHAGATTIIKKVVHKKITEKEIISILRKEGFKKFTTEEHRRFWRGLFGVAGKRNKNPNAQKYGELVMSNMWFWHEESWLPMVREHCQKSGDKYK